MQKKDELTFVFHEKEKDSSQTVPLKEIPIKNVQELEQVLRFRFKLEFMKREFILNGAVISDNADLSKLLKEGVTIHVYPKEIVNQYLPNPYFEFPRESRFIYFQSRKIDFQKQIFEKPAVKEPSKTINPEIESVFFNYIYKSEKITFSTPFTMANTCRSLLDLLTDKKLTITDLPKDPSIVPDKNTCHASAIKSQQDELIYITYHYDVNNFEDQKPQDKLSFKMDMLLHHFDFLLKKDQLRRMTPNQNPKQVYFGIATNFTTWYITTYTPLASTGVVTADNFKIRVFELGNKEAVKSNFKGVLGFLNTIFDEKLN